MPEASDHLSKTIAVAFTTIAVVAGTWVMGPAVLGIDLLLVVALAFWWFHSTTPLAARFSLAFGISFAVHCFHFVEELLTGFFAALPGLLDYAWSPERFAAFNVAWLVAFLAGGIAARRGSSLGRVPVWLLAVASVANGVLHPVLGLQQGGYFPGLWTSLLTLPAGLYLVWTLRGGRG